MGLKRFPIQLCAVFGAQIGKHPQLPLPPYLPVYPGYAGRIQYTIGFTRAPAEGKPVPGYRKRGSDRIILQKLQQCLRSQQLRFRQQKLCWRHSCAPGF
ncbi:hypothetical protein D3C75_827060 [compost metagenome]